MRGPRTLTRFNERKETDNFYTRLAPQKRERTWQHVNADNPSRRSIDLWHAQSLLYLTPR